MRALVVVGWGRPVEFAEVEEPTPALDECLVRVEAVLLGAGDIFFSQGVDHESDDASFVFPHVPGLRGSGVVESSTTGGPAVGTRVAINGAVGCGDCSRCVSGAENLCSSQYLRGLSSGHPGSAAELVAVPARQLHPLPDSLSFTDSLLVADAALLIHAFGRGRLALAESLAVVGAGRIGTMAIAVARAAGADPIVAIDPSEESREAALRAGASAVLDPSGMSRVDLAAAARAACGVSPDVVLEAVGKAETIEGALAIGRAGARTILLGLLGGVRAAPTYYADVISKENELITTFGNTNDEFRAAIQLLASRQICVDALPVRTFDWPKALEAWDESMGAPSVRNAIAVSANGTRSLG
jgi:threonine dehydrogenase-like Zn-dependent dehydrogenase